MKKVIYEGRKYRVSFIEFGFDSSRFMINGEPSDKFINNKAITNLEIFSSLVKLAIEEYIEREKAHKRFKQWDGKL